MSEPRVESVMTTDGRMLLIDRVHQSERSGNYIVVVRAPYSGPWRLADAEVQLFEEALERCNGNKTKAAALLGINVRTLRRRLNGGKR